MQKAQYSVRPQAGQLLFSMNQRLTVLIFRRWYPDSLFCRAVKRTSTLPTPVYIYYKRSCQAPHPPMNVILRIKRATDKSVKFVCYNNILSYIHVKNVAEVTSSVIRDFCSHLGHFGKAGSCDDIDSFGIIPGKNQTTSFISCLAISRYSQKTSSQQIYK